MGYQWDTYIIYLYIYNQQREIWVCLTVLTVGPLPISIYICHRKLYQPPKVYQFVDHVQLYIYTHRIHGACIYANINGVY